MGKCQLQGLRRLALLLLSAAFIINSDRVKRNVRSLSRVDAVTMALIVKHEGSQTTIVIKLSRSRLLHSDELPCPHPALKVETSDRGMPTSTDQSSGIEWMSVKRAQLMITSTDLMRSPSARSNAMSGNDTVQ
jgi:hypothetical protein